MPHKQKQWNHIRMVRFPKWSVPGRLTLISYRHRWAENLSQPVRWIVPIYKFDTYFWIPKRKAPANQQTRKHFFYNSHTRPYVLTLVTKEMWKKSSQVVFSRQNKEKQEWAKHLRMPRFNMRTLMTSKRIWHYGSSSSDIHMSQICQRSKHADISARIWFFY